MYPPPPKLNVGVIAAEVLQLVVVGLKFALARVAADARAMMLKNCIVSFRTIMSVWVCVYTFSLNGSECGNIIETVDCIGCFGLISSYWCVFDIAAVDYFLKDRTQTKVYRDCLDKLLLERRNECKVMKAMKEKGEREDERMRLQLIIRA